MPTEAILQDINAVIGVTGSFVCLNDSSIAAQAMPASFDTANITLTARIASQTFTALEISGQRINEANRTFERARVVLKNLLKTRPRVCAGKRARGSGRTCAGTTCLPPQLPNSRTSRSAPLIRTREKPINLAKVHPPSSNEARFPTGARRFRKSVCNLRKGWVRHPKLSNLYETVSKL